MQAGQFDLKLAFVAAGTLGKNFEDEKCPVVDRHIEASLEVSLLRRAQGLVEQDLGGAAFTGHHLDFFSLATPDKQRRVRGAALAGHSGNRLHPCGLRQQAKLFKIGIKVWVTKINPDQNDAG